MKKFLSLILATLVAFTALGVQPARAVVNIIYVNDDASGAGTGADWTNAFKKLQNALDAAVAGDQIWVAAGIYYPDEGTLQTNNDRTESFILEDNVDLYGGFAGTETQLSQRNIAANPTILSGDIDKNDTNTDGNDIAETTADIVGSNSYHIVLGDNSSSATTFDGFIITAGQANGAGGDMVGAGMYNFYSTPTLVNLTFSGNYASSQGGGLSNYNSDTISLTNVVFTGNSAGLSGGGMQNINNSNAVLTNVTFSGNEAGAGGGMENSLNSQATLTNVTFSQNDGGSQGGGYYNTTGSESTLANVDFLNNSAGYGGGMFDQNGYAQILSNVTFDGNTAGANGGGLYTANNGPYEVRLTYVTFSNNRASQDGGGLYGSGSGYQNLTNVTLSGNTAFQNGGGLYTSGNSFPALTNVTLSGNTASGLGGGAYFDNSMSIPLINTIIANSVSGGDCVLSGGAFINPTSSNNLIEDSSNACGLTNGVSGNIVGLDPLLGPLQNNGGVTETHAITGGSPAFNTGTNIGCPAADQRGIPRPQGGTCDIGAVEVLYVNFVARSISAHDGWILESTETSGNGGSKNSAAGLFYLGDNAQKKQYRSILSFNTSALPDNAIITKVTLKLKRQGVVGGGNPVAMFQGFYSDIKTGPFGGVSLALLDFKSAATMTVGPQSPALSGGWYRLNLTSANSNINKLNTGGGLTQIRVRFKLDDNNNAVANILKLYSGNAGVLNRPQLVIEYYVP
ncbi:MAG: hypothetical protein HYZ21_03515 [Chloroflexi bacterium]|nr:hypothetical protein [Chloroflexota bacterium]